MTHFDSLSFSAISERENNFLVQDMSQR